MVIIVASVAIHLGHQRLMYSYATDVTNMNYVKIAIIKGSVILHAEAYNWHNA